MIRTLLIISGAGLVLATACLAGAAAIGGRDLAEHGWSWTLQDDSDGDTVRFEHSDGSAQPEITKTLAWTGGKSLTVDLSADVDYIQGPVAGVTVTGPAELVQRVRLDGDRLTWVDPDGPNHERVTFGRRRDGNGIWMHSDEVRIVVTAPDVSRFDLEGSADLTLTGYDQPGLDLDISGSGSITATGKTQALSLDISGSGEADLDDLVTTDARVQISGSGEARVAPTGAARINIAGSGDVTLTERPARLESNVSGSGEVQQD